MRNTHLLSVRPVIAVESSWAVWLTVSNQAKTEAAATMNRTEAVVSTVSIVALARLLNVIVR
ncbi:hypothetical protein D3C87_2144090 [compost metagenome]